MVVNNPALLSPSMALSATSQNDLLNIQHLRDFRFEQGELSNLAMLLLCKQSFLTLHTITLVRCRRVADTTLAYVAHYLPHLHKLYLDNCPHLTAQGVQGQYLFAAMDLASDLVAMVLPAALTNNPATLANLLQPAMPGSSVRQIVQLTYLEDDVSKQVHCTFLSNPNPSTTTRPVGHDATTQGTAGEEDMEEDVDDEGDEDDWLASPLPSLSSLSSRSSNSSNSTLSSPPALLSEHNRTLLNNLFAEPAPPTMKPMEPVVLIPLPFLQSVLASHLHHLAQLTLHLPHYAKPSKPIALPSPMNMNMVEKDDVFTISACDITSASTAAAAPMLTLSPTNLRTYTSTTSSRLSLFGCNQLTQLTVHGSLDLEEVVALVEHCLQISQHFQSLWIVNSIANRWDEVELRTIQQHYQVHKGVQIDMHV